LKSNYLLPGHIDILHLYLIKYISSLINKLVNYNSLITYSGSWLISSNILKTGLKFFHKFTKFKNISQLRISLCISTKHDRLFTGKLYTDGASLAYW